MHFFWYNFCTQSFDIRDTVEINTDKEAKEYIPYTDFAQSIYDKLRKAGKLPKEAAREVLILYYGKKVNVK